MFLDPRGGGLIGIGLAGQPGSPIGRLVLNDVGPRVDPVAVQRIGQYLGQPVSFATVDEAVDYVSTIAAPFGLKQRSDWKELVEPTIRPEGGRWVLRYDSKIAVPFKAATPASAAAAEAAMWNLYDRITAPTLVTRGAESDLLTRETLAAMSQRGPRSTPHRGSRYRWNARAVRAAVSASDHCARPSSDVRR